MNRKPVGTQTTYHLDVEAGHTTVTCLGHEIQVAHVEWRTYVYEGDAYRLVTAYDADADNRSWNLDYDEIPAWVPRPPAKWFVLADEIADEVSR